MYSEFISKNLPIFFRSRAKQQIDFLLVLLTVILFYLSFPGGGLSAFAWIALVPVLIALNNTRGRYAFMLGLLAATLGWMASIWWAVDGLVKVSSSNFNLVVPFVFLFCLFSAVPYGIATWLYCRYNWGSSLLGVVKAAAVFTVLVNYIPHLLPGNLAHSLYLSPQQIQLADIGGVPLVFFVIHSVNFLLAMTIIQIRIKSKLIFKYLLLAFVIWSGNWSYGYFKSKQISNQIKQQKTDLTIAMVQPNLAITLREREDWLQHASSVQQLLKEAANNLQTDLIVLPELPVPVSYHDNDADQKIFNKVIKDKTILISTIHSSEDIKADDASYFNAIELIKNQQFQMRYHKQKLIPIGEYLPFETQIPFLRRLFPYAPRYKPGKKSQLLPIELENLTVNLIPLICYEAIFTGLVGSGVSEGGDIFINTVNDAWFGNTAGRKVHFALAMYRTVEYRIPLVRVTNNGISAIIDANGKIIESSLIQPFKAGYSITQVPIAKINSFYQKYPSFFMLICFLISAYAVISGQRKYNE